jgi:hypothetical protein
VPFDSEHVTVRRKNDTEWTVVGDLVYRGRDDVFVVPDGTTTDFATVPRAVVWLIPRFGRYTLPAILHDWLVTEGLAQRLLNSRDADGIFRRSMRELDVPVVRRWLMWTGVRWGALVNPRRRRGWAISAPGVLAITVLAAPVVVPPALLILAALGVYGVVERVVSPRVAESPEDAGSLRT